MTAAIECKDCPFIKICIARLNDRTIKGCGMSLYADGLIKYEEIGVVHAVTTEEKEGE